MAAALRELHPAAPIAVVQPPGAGKTAIAATVAARRHGRDGRAVLVFAPYRALLQQAHLEFRTRAPHLRIGRDILLATTLTAPRVLVRHSARDVGLVIVDEAHFAEDRTGDAILEWAAREAIPVLGLTATPRRGSRYRVAYEVSMAELVEGGFLAATVTEQVSTGVIWRAVEEGCDLSYQSLRELARNVDRNEIVVAETLARPHLRPAFVFACDIPHARELARGFKAAGLRAHEFHQDHAGSSDSLAAFRAGQADLLVGVNGLALGIDVPRARGVVLARPTMSRILLTQMIGRGTRLDPATGKDRVHVLEFADRSGGASRILSAASVGRPATRSWRSIRKHRFEPLGEPSHMPSDADPRIAGTWYRRGQTFGIEIEIAQHRGLPSDRMFELVKSEMLASVETALGCADRWTITLDSSAGWELVSPILEGGSGLEEMVLAADAVTRVADRHGLAPDRRCGLHVHLGLNNDYRLVRRVFRAARLFESGAATIVAPSRIAAFDGTRYSTRVPNGFCVPLRVAVPRVRVDRAVSLADLTASRYLSVNPLALTEHGTVEVRLHHGTLDPSKIALWISLWQQLVTYAERAKRIQRVNDVRWLEPDGDIVALAARLLPGADDLFLERLRRRRDEIVGRWNAPGLEPWSSYRERWRSGS